MDLRLNRVNDRAREFESEKNTRATDVRATIDYQIGTRLNIEVILPVNEYLFENADVDSVYAEH